MIEFQRKLLGDRIRNDALFRALKAVVTPGCTVTDIGSGTGFLSFLALKLGAKRCYLYETSRDLLALSKRIARENSLHHRCTFVNAHSHNIRSPMKTDIVISETLGNFAFEEHIIETMNDARRFLKAGGTLIPQKLRQYASPIVTDRLWREINVWDDTHPTLDFAAAKEVALNNMYVKTIEPSDILLDTRTNKKNSLPRRGRVRERGYDQTIVAREHATPVKSVSPVICAYGPPPPNPLPPGGGMWDAIDFAQRNSSHHNGSITWNLQRATTIYGFALWWECDLVPGLTLSTSPFARPTHWEQIFLPLLSPITAKKGNCLTCVIASDSNHRTGLNVIWKTTLHRGKLHVMGQQQELRKGMIFP